MHCKLPDHSGGELKNHIMQRGKFGQCHAGKIYITETDIGTIHAGGLQL